MEAGVPISREASGASLFRWSACVLSFAALAPLNGRAIDTRAGFVSAYAICMWAFALLALAGIAALVHACNREARESGGFRASMDAVAGGFAFMLPFALLALAAELLLDWNAAQVFTQSGIMICGTLAGAEAARMGGGKASRAIPPLAGAFLFSFLWTLLSAAAQAVAR